MSTQHHADQTNGQNRHRSAEPAPAHALIALRGRTPLIMVGARDDDRTALPQLVGGPTTRGAR